MRNKTLLGVIGIILAILGVTGTIPLALRDKPYIYGLPITIIMIIVGIILIAYAFGD